MLKLLTQATDLLNFPHQQVIRAVFPAGRFRRGANPKVFVTVQIKESLVKQSHLRWSKDP